MHMSSLANQANPHILYGALIGGTLQDDSFDDDRTNYKQNEVTTDYNAGFQSLIVGLKQLNTMIVKQFSPRKTHGAETKKAALTEISSIDHLEMFEKRKRK